MKGLERGTDCGGAEGSIKLWKVENDTGLMFGCGRMGRRQVLLAFGPVARGQWYKRPWEK